jgi:hypothetical protein
VAGAECPSPSARVKTGTFCPGHSAVAPRATSHGSLGGVIQEALTMRTVGENEIFSIFNLIASLSPVQAVAWTRRSRFRAGRVFLERSPYDCRAYQTYRLLHASKAEEVRLYTQEATALVVLRWIFGRDGARSLRRMTHDIKRFDASNSFDGTGHLTPVSYARTASRPNGVVLETIPALNDTITRVVFCAARYLS